jgi:hypothetical protein
MQTTRRTTVEDSSKGKEDEDAAQHGSRVL